VHNPSAQGHDMKGVADEIARGERKCQNLDCGNLLTGVPFTKAGFQHGNGSFCNYACSKRAMMALRFWKNRKNR